MYIIILAWAYDIFSLDVAGFIFALIPLIIVIAGVWGYGLKAKFPGGEIDYYPVDRIMQSPTTISGMRTVAEAEGLMERERVDFINIIDRLGRLRGIFTRADAHEARKNRRVAEKISGFV